jgi:hypothetical protein
VSSFHCIKIIYSLGKSDLRIPASRKHQTPVFSNRLFTLLPHPWLLLARPRSQAREIREPMGTGQHFFLLTSGPYIIVIPTVISFCLSPSSRWFLARLIFDPEDGGDTLLRNVGSCTDYTALYPRRWQFSKVISVQNITELTGCDQRYRRNKYNQDVQAKILLTRSRMQMHSAQLNSFKGTNGMH